MFLKVVDEAAAAGDVEGMYEAERIRRGYLPNYVRPFSLHPGAYTAWVQLIGSIVRAMDQRRYELVTVAAARRLKSTYCAMAHTKVLRDNDYLADPALERVMTEPSEVLDATEATVVAFAEKVADNASSIGSDDIAGLRDAGLDDSEIFNVILAAAARCFFSTVIDAAGAATDAELATEFPPALRDLLVVGRPPDGDKP